MKQFWIYAAVFLLGSISGIIFWEKYNVNVLYKGVFKLKQRGRDNTMQTDIKAELTPKQTRQERRATKKQGKVSRRNAKKQRKAEKRLDI